MRPSIDAFGDEMHKSAAMPGVLRNVGQALARGAMKLQRSARRGLTDQLDPLQRIQTRVRAGDFDSAEGLARDLHERGRLPVRPEGYPVGNLGHGAEAVAQHVIGAADAPTTVAVRKAFDPKGSLYSKQMLAEKMQAGRKLRGRPEFAQLLSQRLGKTEQGGRFLLYERAGSRAGVPGGVDPRRATSTLARHNATLQKLRGGAPKTRDPRALADIHADNIVRGPKGEQVVDYLPIRKSDQQTAQAGRTPLGERLSRLGFRFDNTPFGVQATLPGNKPATDAQISYYRKRLRAAADRLRTGSASAPGQIEDAFPLGLELPRASRKRALQGFPD